MKTRICKCCKNREKVSLFKIWKKIHFSNEYTQTREGSLWRVSTKFKLISKICFLCYGLVFAWFYLWYLQITMIDTSGNILLVMLNLIALLMPLFVVELMLVYTVGIECKEEGKNIKSNK